MAVISDALKMVFRDQRDPQDLAAFVTIRQRFRARRLYNPDQAALRRFGAAKDARTSMNSASPAVAGFSPVRRSIVEPYAAR